MNIDLDWAGQPTSSTPAARLRLPAHVGSFLEALKFQNAPAFLTLSRRDTRHATSARATTRRDRASSSHRSHTSRRHISRASDLSTLPLTFTPSSDIASRWSTRASSRPLSRVVLGTMSCCSLMCSLPRGHPQTWRRVAARAERGHATLDSRRALSAASFCSSSRRSDGGRWAGLARCGPQWRAPPEQRQE